MRATRNPGGSTVSTTSSVTIAINILASPAEAFRALKERPTFLLPMLLLMVAATTTTAWFFGGIDIQAFFEQLLAASGKLTDAQVTNVTERLAEFPRQTYVIGFAIGTPFSIVIGLLLYSFYFKVVTWIVKDEISYKHWFSLAAWSALPTVLSQIASIVNMLSGDFSLMPLTKINPLTLTSLLGVETLGSANLDELAVSYDPMKIWAIVLAIVGYKIFTGRGIGRALLVVLIPTALRIAQIFVS
jgi:Yip1 domain